MSLSSTEIGRIVARLDDELRAAVVQKVLSPAAADRIVLELRLPGNSSLLQIVLSPATCRIGRIAGRSALAVPPHPFVMLLRREAVGQRVSGVARLGGDRAVEIRFAAGDRAGSLVAELTGRHANLLWLDAKGVIRGSFHPNRSRARPLVPGNRYVPLSPRPASSESDRFGDTNDPEHAVEEHYAAREAGEDLERRRSILARELRHARARLERLLEKLKEDRRKAEEGEHLQRLAHVLQANLRQVRPGMRLLVADDFEGNEVQVPLDPSLGPGANLNRLFDRAGRMRRAAPRVDERIRAARERALIVAGLDGELANADEDELAVIADRLFGVAPRAETSQRAGGRGREQRLPYREYLVGAGRPARVGRSAADNDRLTLRHARPDDLWLHSRGMGGSHVVVPMGRGEDPGQDLLLDAAHLAAHFSKARGDDDVEVTWTRRRYVQKPRGSTPGSVRILNEKTILVRVEPARLARILGGDRGSSRT